MSITKIKIAKSAPAPIESQSRRNFPIGEFLARRSFDLLYDVSDILDTGQIAHVDD
jgi:hypothetical protein